MTQINLELFFYRRHKVANTLKKLNKDFPGLIESKPDYTDSEIYEYLPPKYIKKAENTVIPFKWLFVFENDFRELCREVLGRNYDLSNETEFFDKVKINEEESKIIKKRMKGEEASLSTSRADSDVLDFFTLPELKNLILNNWEIFEEDIPRGKRFIDTLINQLNRPRITVAHFFELDDLDIKELENRLLRYYKTFE